MAIVPITGNRASMASTATAPIIGVRITGDRGSMASMVIAPITGGMPTASTVRIGDSIVHIGDIIATAGTAITPIGDITVVSDRRFLKGKVDPNINGARVVRRAEDDEGFHD